MHKQRTEQLLRTNAISSAGLDSRGSILQGNTLDSTQPFPRPPSSFTPRRVQKQDAVEQPLYFGITSQNMKVCLWVDPICCKATCATFEVVFDALDTRDASRSAQVGVTCAPVHTHSKSNISSILLGLEALD
eukprot:3525679-Amphidinium_carterae.1